MNKTYSDYLKSNQWESVKKRYKISKYPQFCYVCHRPDVPLDLHHKTYKRIFNESLCDLILLCRTCHGLTHKIQTGSPDIELIDAARKLKQLLGLRKRKIARSPFYNQIALKIINSFNVSGSPTARSSDHLKRQWKSHEDQKTNEPNNSPQA